MKNDIEIQAKIDSMRASLEDAKIQSKYSEVFILFGDELKRQKFEIESLEKEIERVKSEYKESILITRLISVVLFLFIFLVMLIAT